MTQQTWVRRRILQIAWDAFSWVFAVPIALLFRYDFSVSQNLMLIALAAGFVAALVHILAGSIFHLYQGRYVVGSFDEVLGIVVTTLFVGGLGTLALFFIPPSTFPRSTFIIATGIAAASMLGARFLWRGTRQQRALNRDGKRTLIYGAGDAGSQIVTLMLNDRHNEYQPIGFIDDDPRKQHLRRSGIRVLGTKELLNEILIENEIDVLLIAIAGIGAKQLLDLESSCSPLGIAVRVIPTASDIAGGTVRLGDISDVTEEDLMGRRSITTDEKQITNFIQGKCVLVTGAGGSIGSELCRQIARYNPEHLYLLDRDESALHAVQLTLDGSGTLDSDHLILADIRDHERVNHVFNMFQPQLVFHAAALKHLPLLERYPAEAYKTNVLGTKNVLNAAMESGVNTFVNISTDKAADPTSALGYSKLITERATAGTGASNGETYVSVRFGNVLGSRGSVLHTFRYQIEKGGPLTVTDENVTRYFMTIREAVHLVLQASVLGKSGETLILDMGSPVNIAEMARYMIRRSGKAIEIRFTGIRAGEKLHEVLIAREESVSSNLHPLITHAKTHPLNRDLLTEDFDPSNAYELLIKFAKMS
jgi:FlaA1/EpsC-like NDP-sugar epimerase